MCLRTGKDQGAEIFEDFSITITHKVVNFKLRHVKNVATRG